MNNIYIPRLSLNNPASTMVQPTLQGKVNKIASNDGGAFKNLITQGLEKVNTTLQQPDAMMKSALTTGDVDVHDVMIANAKAELTVNMTAQVATKVVQAYDRVLQIQI